MNLIIVMLFIFTSIAFFTIMERKLLGIFHVRLGPSKVGMIGIFQPLSDVLKLFSKNAIKLSKINMFFWNSSPILVFLLFLILLMFIPIKFENNLIMMNKLMMILILNLFIFPFFWGSFFSFSKFSIISSKRLVSQMISYEMGLMMLLIVSSVIFMKFNIILIFKLMNIFFMSMMPIMSMMFLMVLSESSRTPFDFIEGESELVSGFNTEFSGIFFSLFFIYEYGMMIFFSIITSLFLNFILSFILIYLFIFIRASFPRMRYDQMMIYLWKMFYPIMITILIFLKFN